MLIDENPEIIKFDINCYNNILDNCIFTKIKQFIKDRKNPNFLLCLSEANQKTIQQIKNKFNDNLFSKTPYLLTVFQDCFFFNIKTISKFTIATILCSVNKTLRLEKLNFKDITHKRKNLFGFFCTKGIQLTKLIFNNKPISINISTHIPLESFNDYKKNINILFKLANQYSKKYNTIVLINGDLNTRDIEGELNTTRFRKLKNTKVSKIKNNPTLKKKYLQKNQKSDLLNYLLKINNYNDNIFFNTNLIKCSVKNCTNMATYEYHKKNKFYCNEHKITGCIKKITYKYKTKKINKRENKGKSKKGVNCNKIRQTLYKTENLRLGNPDIFLIFYNNKNKDKVKKLKSKFENYYDIQFYGSFYNRNSDHKYIISSIQYNKNIIKIP